jgi:hypothetical protein
MVRQWTVRLFKDDVVALESNAESARLALACAYSSSDEFEADVIQSRREAGMYGPRPHWRHAAYAIVAAAAGASLLVML